MGITTHRQLVDAIDNLTAETTSKLEKKLIISQFVAFNIPEDEIFLILNDAPDLLSHETIRKLRQEMIFSLVELLCKY